MKKRLITLLLCALMVVNLIPGFASADNNEITSISVTGVTEPKDGEKITYDSSRLVEGNPSLYTAYYLLSSWRDTGDRLGISGDEDNYFIGGYDYQLTLFIVPSDNATGLNDSTANNFPVTINGKNATFWTSGTMSEGDPANGKKYYAYRVTFSCPWSTTVSVINVNGFVPPVVGQYPCTKDDLSVPEGAPYRIVSASWREYIGDVGAGDDDFSTSSVFKADKGYYINIKIALNSGYSLSENVSYYLNGIYDYADNKYSGKTGSLNNIILYSADFITEIPHIDSIYITGVVEPQDAVAIPFDSSKLIMGEGLKYSAKYWDYSWSCSDGIILPDSVNAPQFRGGINYTLTLLIKAENGAIGLNEETAAALPVIINGKTAKYNPECKPEDDVFAYCIDFFCPWTNKVSVVDVYGFLPPTPGATPCLLSDLSVPEGAPYEISSFAWFMKTDDYHIIETDQLSSYVFEKDIEYYIQLSIELKSGYSYDTDVIFYLNGSSEYIDSESCIVFTNTARLCSLDIKAEERHIDKIVINGYGPFYDGAEAGEALKQLTIPASVPYSLIFEENNIFKEGNYINDDDKFISGYQYSMRLRIQAKPGWIIDEYTVWNINNGTISTYFFHSYEDSYYGTLYAVNTEELVAEVNQVIFSWYLDPDDEYAVAGVEIKQGTIYGAPSEPGKEGYIFGGWYLDRECTVPYDPTAPIYEDTSVFPKWIPEDGTVKISLYTWPENEVPYETIILPAGTVNYIPEAPEPPEQFPNNIFTRWYTESNLIYSYDPTLPITEDISLYAHFGDPENIVTVSLYMNPMDSQPYDLIHLYSWDGISPYPIKPMKDGYVFAGWYKDRDLREFCDVYNKTENITFKKNTSLFAKWIPEADAVHVYTYLTGDAEEPLADYVIESGSKFEVPFTPYYQDDVFDGWYTDPSYNLGYFYHSDVTINQDTNLYAKWFPKENGYYVYVSGLYKDGEEYGAHFYVKPGQSLSYYIDYPGTHHGYVFMGWFKDLELTIPVEATDPINEDSSFYAKWVSWDDVFSISLYSGDLKWPYKELYVYKNTVYGLPEQPSKSGYVFNGWYTNVGFTEKYIPNQPVTDHLALYASWIPEDQAYSVSVFPDAYSETPLFIEYIIPNSIYGLPPEPGKENCHFFGWYTDRALSKAYDPTVPITEDINLFAKWFVRVSIYQTPSDQKPVSTFRVNYMDWFTPDPYTPQAPAGMEGYIFGGWFSDTSLLNRFMLDEPLTEDVSLYPKWCANAISAIEITGYEAPVLGHYPVSNNQVHVIDGAPYRLNEVFWNQLNSEGSGPADEPFTGQFEKGQLYQFCISVYPDDDWQFIEEPSLILNGKTTSPFGAFYNTGTGCYEFSTFWTAPETEKYITDIPIIGFEEPVAGNYPVLNNQVRAAEGSSFWVNNVIWYKVDPKNPDDIEVFNDLYTEGDTYYCEITINPYSGWLFSDEPSITINGKTELVWTDMPIDAGYVITTTWTAARIDYQLQEVSNVFRWWTGNLNLEEANQLRLDINGDDVLDLRDAAEMFVTLNTVDVTVSVQAEKPSAGENIQKWVDENLNELIVGNKTLNASEIKWFCAAGSIDSDTFSGDSDYKFMVCFEQSQYLNYVAIKPDWAFSAWIEEYDADDGTVQKRLAITYGQSSAVSVSVDAEKPVTGEDVQEWITKYLSEIMIDGKAVPVAVESTCISSPSPVFSEFEDSAYCFRISFLPDPTLEYTAVKPDWAYNAWLEDFETNDGTHLKRLAFSYRHYINESLSLVAEKPVSGQDINLWAKKGLTLINDYGTKIPIIKVNWMCTAGRYNNSKFIGESDFRFALIFDAHGIEMIHAQKPDWAMNAWIEDVESDDGGNLKAFVFTYSHHGAPYFLSVNIPSEISGKMVQTLNSDCTFTLYDPNDVCNISCEKKWYRVTKNPVSAATEFSETLLTTDNMLEGGDYYCLEISISLEDLNYVQNSPFIEYKVTGDGAYRYNKEKSCGPIFDKATGSILLKLYFNANVRLPVEKMIVYSMPNVELNHKGCEYEPKMSIHVDGKPITDFDVNWSVFEEDESGIDTYGSDTVFPDNKCITSVLATVVFTLPDAVSSYDPITCSLNGYGDMIITPELHAAEDGSISCFCRIKWDFNS